jgi:Anti-sigma-K factor rskA
MIEDHEETQAVLGAYALHALDAQEAERAERLMLTHLPECAECREAFEDFQRISGELALAAGSRRPPRLLGARLHRQLRSSRRRWMVSAVVSAAAVVALVGLAGWNAHLSTRMSDAESRQARTRDFLATVSHPLSHVVPLSASQPSSSPSAASVQLAAAFMPGGKALFLFGSLPEPRADRVYQLWVLRDGHFESAGTFRPEDRGQVLFRIKADVDRIRGLLVTEEPSQGSTTPSNERVVTASF